MFTVRSPVCGCSTFLSVQGALQGTENRRVLPSRPFLKLWAAYPSPRHFLFHPIPSILFHAEAWTFPVPCSCFCFFVVCGCFFFASHSTLKGTCHESNGSLWVLGIATLWEYPQRIETNPSYPLSLPLWMVSVSGVC